MLPQFRLQSFRHTPAWHRVYQKGPEALQQLPQRDGVWMASAWELRRSCQWHLWKEERKSTWVVACLSGWAAMWLGRGLSGWFRLGGWVGGLVASLLAGRRFVWLAGVACCLLVGWMARVLVAE